MKITEVQAREVAERLLKSAQIINLSEYAALCLEGHDVICALIEQNTALRNHIERGVWARIGELFRR